MACTPGGNSRAPSVQEQEGSFGQLVARPTFRHCNGYFDTLIDATNCALVADSKPLQDSETVDRLPTVQIEHKKQPFSESSNQN